MADAHFEIPEFQIRVAYILRMRQLQADVSGFAPRIASVGNLFAVEHDDEMIAVDRRFDRVPLVWNDLHVVRRLAHVHHTAGEEITAAVVAGVSVADLQLVTGAAGIGRRFLAGCAAPAGAPGCAG